MRRGRWAAGALRAPGDRGAGTVIAVGVAGVLVAVAVAGLVLASVLVAGQRARSAADLAALAAAGRAGDGDASGACPVAASVAAANDGLLSSCRVEGTEVEVVVAVGSPAWPEPARARSRAGPAR